jgi:hypothetical protein
MHDEHGTHISEQRKGEPFQDTDVTGCTG